MKGFIFSMMLAASVWGGEAAKSAHILVVDHVGRPVAGANLVLFGLEIRNSPAIKERDGHMVLVQSDDSGRVAIELDKDSWGSFKKIWKDGYKFEEFQNPAIHSYITVKDTFENPHRFVLRKLEDEKACMLNPIGVKFSAGWRNDGCNYYFTWGNGRKRADIDFFSRVSEAKPEWNHMRYTDFSVEPHFDSCSRQWSFTLMTTNSGCGIIATTNRVLMAPEKGYSQQVRVSSELYSHPCFTLYFRTRTPRVYAMISFTPGEYFGIKGYSGDDSETPNFKFGFENLLINPTGGRTFEEDDSLEEAVAGGSVADTIRSDAWHDFLFEHRYPRPPDVSARIKNRKAKKLLFKELLELKNKSRDLDKQIKQIESKMAGRLPAEIEEATKALRTEEKRIQDLARARGEECDRLDKEVHTLFLDSK